MNVFWVCFMSRVRMSDHLRFNIQENMAVERVMYTYMYVYTCFCVYMCMYICVNIYIYIWYICIYIHTYIYTYRHTCIWIDICIYVCISYTYVYTNIHMYSYIIFICVAQVSFVSKFGISDHLRIYIYTIEYVYEWLRPTLTLFKKLRTYILILTTNSFSFL